MRVLSERGLLKGSADHGVTRSLYTADPDGNEIELTATPPARSGRDASTRS